MAFSKESRIITLLVIDGAFFFLEIIVGYAVGSLALVADSFHMLNDVMSLIVALYAVRLSQKGNETRDPRYSYGWQRAEILGALINGVFLLALCFSIFMEAIERFVNVSEVQNPRLVVVVGALGLASNIVGLFLFHDHGHSHGGHSHSHGHTHSVDDGHTHDAHQSHNEHAHADEGADEVDVFGAPSSPTAKKRTSQGHNRRQSLTRRRERSDSVGSFIGHPAATRAYVVRTAQDLGYDAQTSAQVAANDENNERTPLLRRQEPSYSAADNHAHDIESASGHKSTEVNGKRKSFLGKLTGRGSNASHDHAHGGEHSHGHGGGHSHGDGEGSMNMRGVFLHVLGDALGNVGVIASGLFIWYSTAGWRFYTDPAISFLITIIIFHSALPLVKSASFILLQGVPSAVPLDEVHQSLLEVPGVISVHELHIWQLSEAKNVASVHVLIDVDEANLTEEQRNNVVVHTHEASSSDHGTESETATPGENAQSKSTLIPQEHRYMDIAAQIRGKLHRFNIHSSTIQPEFIRGGMRSVARAHGVEIDEHVTSAVGKLVTTQGELVERHLTRNGASACLIACGPDGSCVEAACCPPLPDSASAKSGRNTPSLPSAGVQGHEHGANPSSS